MVERFSGRIADILKTQRFNDAQDLDTATDGVCGAVQPSTASVSAGWQDTDAHDETVVRDSPAFFQEAAHDHPGCVS